MLYERSEDKKDGAAAGPAMHELLLAPEAHGYRSLVQVVYRRVPPGHPRAYFLAAVLPGYGDPELTVRLTWLTKCDVAAPIVRQSAGLQALADTLVFPKRW